MTLLEELNELGNRLESPDDRVTVAKAEIALQRINQLRSNVIATQNASWSNTMYPLVAILNDAGVEQTEPSSQERQQHLKCYGGAGGMPGAPK